MDETSTTAGGYAPRSLFAAAAVALAAAVRGSYAERIKRVAHCMCSSAMPRSSSGAVSNNPVVCPYPAL